MALILTRADVRRIIRMQDVIEAVERAHHEYAAKRAAQPTRTTVQLAGSTGAILPMAATIPNLDAAGLKLLSIFPDNREHGLPVLNAVVVLVDPTTGRCCALIEGGVLTAFRTAAASAVATQVLARDDAHTLALVGAGIEAGTHLEAIRSVRAITDVRVWSRSHATVETFLAEAPQGDGVRLTETATVEEAVRDADIICTLTPAKDPIVCGRWFAPGTHVNAVGTHWLDHREIDTEAVTRARVVVDSREAQQAECGDLMIPVAEGAITTDYFKDELGEILAGEKPGRESDDQITMFQSVGLAIQDVATARFLYQRAQAEGVGTEIPLW
jgi:alanine dehydrogenase